MLEVGCPEPALVVERIESTRSCAASSATVSSPVSDVAVIVVMMTPSPCARTTRWHPVVPGRVAAVGGAAPGGAC